MVEFLQKIDEAPKEECPKCQANALRRCISAPSVRLSGGGYYETDEKPKDKQRNVLRKDTSESATQ